MATLAHDQGSMPPNPGNPAWDDQPTLASYANAAAAVASLPQIASSRKAVHSLPAITEVMVLHMEDTWMIRQNSSYAHECQMQSSRKSYWNPSMGQANSAPPLGGCGSLHMVYPSQMTRASPLTQRTSKQKYGHYWAQEGFLCHGPKVAEAGSQIDKQNSSITFAISDPDGSIANTLMKGRSALFDWATTARTTPAPPTPFSTHGTLNVWTETETK
ncbi:hypothetical protein BJV74DRAFT_793931 [Russula compacta]|nr:hypothetical protein BJV74DRAFT_793931 [Russula compacta]